MKHIAAIVMGFLASILVYLPLSPLSSPIPILALIACWFASSYLLQRGAKTTVQVLTRGFLLGAAEWLSIIGVCFIAAAIGGSNSVIKAVMLGGVSLFMTLLCLGGFATVQIWQRGTSPSVSDTR